MTPSHSIGGPTCIRACNGKRDYNEWTVSTVLYLVERCRFPMPMVARDTGIPLKTIKNWKYGPRGERVRGL